MTSDELSALVASVREAEGQIDETWKNKITGDGTHLDYDAAVLRHFMLCSRAFRPLCDAIEELQAENRRLREAARKAMEWLGDPDADTLEEWERIAEMFYCDTGFLRPGKDYPMEGPTPNEAKQREAWNEWCVKQSCDIRRGLRAALSEPSP